LLGVEVWCEDGGDQKDGGLECDFAGETGEHETVEAP
jgi:hypothetical protein